MTAYPMVPIRRLAQVTLGKMLQSSPTSPDDVESNYLRAAHVQPDGRLISFDDDQTMWFSPEELRRLGLARGDVVVVEGGAGFGRSAFMERSMSGWAFQNSIVRVRPTARAEGRFLDYALQSALHNGLISLVCRTATFPHFTAEKVAAFPLPAPLIDEQRRIADFLHNETAQIDLLIDKQKKLVSTLRERRTAVVVAGVTGKDRLAPGTQSGPSWVGAIPAHWEVKPLKRVFSSITTGAWGDEAEGGSDDILCVRVADFDRPRLTVPMPVETSRKVAASDRLNRALQRGDLLIEKSGGTSVNPVGFVASYDSDMAAVCANFIARLRPDSGQVSRYWLYALHGSYANGLTWRSVKQTTGIQNLDMGAFMAESFAVPPFEEQLTIARNLDAKTKGIDKLLSKAERFIELARERRAALITAAVTAQLDISKEAA